MAQKLKITTGLIGGDVGKALVLDTCRGSARLDYLPKNVGAECITRVAEMSLRVGWGHGSTRSRRGRSASQRPPS
jgi:hypothetical protein